MTRANELLDWISILLGKECWIRLLIPCSKWFENPRVWWIHWSMFSTSLSILMAWQTTKYGYKQGSSWQIYNYSIWIPFDVVLGWRKTFVSCFSSLLILGLELLSSSFGSNFLCVCFHFNPSLSSVKEKKSSSTRKSERRVVEREILWKNPPIAHWVNSLTFYSISK